MPLRMGSSTSSFGDDNDLELSSRLEISSNLEVIESSAAAAVPSANIGVRKLAATSSNSFNISGDDNDEEWSSDLDKSSDFKVIESSSASAVPLEKLGYQQLSCATWGYDVVASSLNENIFQVGAGTFGCQHNITRQNWVAQH